MTKRRRLDPSPLREFLPGVLRGLKPPGRLERIREAWAEVVGPVVASRTRVVGCEEGRLKVEVASAPLKHDLSTFRREEILGGLDERLPDLKIKAVRYTV